MVKTHTLKKMATQFQTFKKSLYMKYVQNRLTPSFNTYPKLEGHWDKFIEYKLSAEGQTLSALAKKNASKKKYHHRLGTGGYAKKVPQWEKQEQDLLSKGIRSQTHG